MRKDYTEWRSRWPRVVTECDTQTALGLLRDYYRTRSNGLPLYTGARFEATAALNPDPNSIGPADMVAVTLLSVRVPKEAAVRLLDLKVASGITELLKAIPTNEDIVDVDEAPLRGNSEGGKLWTLLRSGKDGLGRTTTSKLLAAKRPRLFPIWDSFVQEATGLDTEDYWAKFQTVLQADERKIWNWLEGLKKQVPGLPADIATLRILDVVLWMLVENDRLDS